MPGTMIQNRGMASPNRPSSQQAAHTRVVVVDDDPEILALLARYLGSHHMEVAGVGSGAALRDELRRAPADLVLLDLGLPDEDGLNVLQGLRREWPGPVIVITGRGEAVERVVGLELGADDYVAKPFDLRELLARIRSVLRRSQPATVAPQGRMFEFDGMLLDAGSQELRDAEGREIPLTAKEFELLKALLDAPQQVLSRDRLMNALHGRAAGPFERAIDVTIGRLRRKVERDPANPRLIKAVRGAGYMLTVDVVRK